MSVGPSLERDDVVAAIRAVVVSAHSSMFLRHDVSTRALEKGRALDDFADRLVLPVLERLGYTITQPQE